VRTQYYVLGFTPDDESNRPSTKRLPIATPNIGSTTENDIDTRGRGISARNQKCLETYWGNSRAATNIGQRPGESAAESPAVPPSEILSEPPYPQGVRLLLIKPESFAGKLESCLSFSPEG